MVRLLVAGIALVLVTASLGAELADLSAMTASLSEDDFEDFLDRWFQQDFYRRRPSRPSRPNLPVCEFRVNGDLGQPQPVYIHNNNYLRPDGSTGIVRLTAGQTITIACPGNRQSVQHPQIIATASSHVATCVSNNLVSGAGWLNGNGAFGGLTCSSNPTHVAEATNERCNNNQNSVARVGYIVQGVFHLLYRACYDAARTQVLFSWTEQNENNAVHQTNVDRPNWQAGNFFGRIGIDNLYSQANQIRVLNNLVGQALTNTYLNGNVQYLARGHLVAKTDMIYASGQRATFYFINAVPQWQSINNGNWNILEQDLRARIGTARYQTTIWTGAFGVTQLRNQQNVLVNVYLRDNDKLPVPLYMYKVVYDARRREGTAFITINNPFYTLPEAQALRFCTDRCRNNADFNWLGWHPDDIRRGYSFCCTVDDFRRHIAHLPQFVTNGLLV